MSVLYDFLQRNGISQSKSLPLVHTTRAANLQSILRDGSIRRRRCDVFLNEDLNYFFVGRPAYKFDLSRNAKFWELPVCFVMKYDVGISPRRRFPFDSGGFAKKNLPSFMEPFNLDAFEVAKDFDANRKIIGTFFGSPFNYFRSEPKSNIDPIGQFDISKLDAELHALQQLTVSRDSDFDDRHFVIEEQYDADINLANNQLGAIIIPDIYLEDPCFLELADSYQCKVISYNTYPLNPEAYYYAIYEHIETYFHDEGLL